MNITRVLGLAAFTVICSVVLIRISSRGVAKRATKNPLGTVNFTLKSGPCTELVRTTFKLKVVDRDSLLAAPQHYNNQDSPIKKGEDTAIGCYARNCAAPPKRLPTDDAEACFALYALSEMLGRSNSLGEKPYLEKAAALGHSVAMVELAAMRVHKTEFRAGVKNLTKIRDELYEQGERACQAGDNAECRELFFNALHASRPDGASGRTTMIAGKSAKDISEHAIQTACARGDTLSCIYYGGLYEQRGQAAQADELFAKYCRPQGPIANVMITTIPLKKCLALMQPR